MNPMFDDLIGKPYEDMARGPDAYDCWGLIIEVASRVGKVIPDYENVVCGEEAKVEGYLAHKGEYVKLSVREAEPGDVVVWKQIDGHLHFGVVEDRYHFLHTRIELGVRRNRMDNPIIQQLIDGVYRWIKI
jgi:probable lipoprotein NlpC